jgi:hypothetical protein
MPLTIDRALLSWVRAVSLPAVAAATGLSPGPSVGTPAGHLEALRQAAPGATTGWRRPWEAHQAYNRFWYRHLALRDKYWAIDPAKCWPRLVPLWDSTALTWSGTATRVGLQAERLLFPCATAAILTVEVTGPLSLDDLVAVAEQVRTGTPIAVAGGPPKHLLPLLSELLGQSQQAVLGHQDPDSSGVAEPLLVATVVAGSGVTTLPALVDQNALHRRLHALARADVAPAAPPPLAASSATTSRAQPAGGRLLVEGRSRVVWSPKLVDPAKAHQLECYHHNLSLGTAFVEALLAYVGGVAGGGTRPEVAKHAVNLLGMFYGPAPDIWSSSALADQIDASGQLPSISLLRQQLAGWGPLARRSAPAGQP